YLENLDSSNEYVVLLKPSDIERYEPGRSNFRKLLTPHKEFTFSEQLGFARLLYRLKAGLVHFGMTQQPLLYRKLAITTIHDLTTARFYNPAKNRLLFTFKQLLYKFVIKRVARKSVAIITASQFVKDDVVQYTGVTPAKIHVIYEAAD